MNETTNRWKSPTFDTSRKSARASSGAIATQGAKVRTPSRVYARDADT